MNPQWTAIPYLEEGAEVQARELGRSELLPITDDLRAAIAADQARQRAKAECSE